MTVLPLALFWEQRFIVAWKDVFRQRTRWRAGREEGAWTMLNGHTNSKDDRERELEPEAERTARGWFLAVFAGEEMMLWSRARRGNDGRNCSS